jgi:hypothetical protein
LAQTSTFCPHRYLGCNWQGQQQHLAQHIDNCSHLACPNKQQFGCPFVGNSDELHIHQQICHRSIDASATDCSAAVCLVGNSDARVCANDDAARTFAIQIEAMLAATFVIVDAGGKIFKTTESTLRREKGSLFDELLSGIYELQRTNDNTVNINLDCEPAAFAHVLYWLRTYVTLLRTGQSCVHRH